MKLEILTPRGKEIAREVKTITLPTYLGEISVLANHTPLISVLRPGKIKIKTGDEKDILIEIEGGIIEVLKNQIVVLLKKF